VGEADGADDRSDQHEYEAKEQLRGFHDRV
jgi:hypothetical protein